MTITYNVKINGNPFQLSFPVEQITLCPDTIGIITKIFLSVLKKAETNAADPLLTKIDPSKAFAISLYEDSTPIATTSPTAVQTKNYNVKIIQETAPNTPTQIFSSKGSDIGCVTSIPTSPTNEIAINTLPSIASWDVSKTASNLFYPHPSGPSLGSPTVKQPSFSLRNMNLTFTNLFLPATPAPATAAPAPGTPNNQAQTEVLDELVEFFATHQGQPIPPKAEGQERVINRLVNSYPNTNTLVEKLNAYLLPDRNLVAQSAAADEISTQIIAALRKVSPQITSNGPYSALNRWKQAISAGEEEE